MRNYCTVAECDRVVEGFGLCRTHYARYKRTGVVPTTPIRPATDAERFWLKVNKTDTCWLWTGATSSEGRYGTAICEKRQQPAHRVAYQLLVGPIPDGLDIDHLCRVTLCVRPGHLEPVDHRTNVLRGTSKQAQNAVKTHCKRGHEFTPENTRMRPLGRNCRQCDRDREKTRVRGRAKVVMP